MKNNKIIIIVLTLIFTIFLVGCPGPDIKLPNENLVLNMGFMTVITHIRQKYI